MNRTTEQIQANCFIVWSFLDYLRTTTRSRTRRRTTLPPAPSRPRADLARPATSSCCSTRRMCISRLISARRRRRAPSWYGVRALSERRNRLRAVTTAQRPRSLSFGNLAARRLARDLRRSLGDPFGTQKVNATRSAGSSVRSRASGRSQIEKNAATAMAIHSAVP
jgi:hypothetical protein